jgi:light-regulated signal transduction histidine kinase (bacteriophytochrome)
MLIFFVFKTMVVFKYIHHSTFTHYFEWLSVIFFMPPFFVVVKEFLAKKKLTSQKLDEKNIYLEHAAKIIRHDMHSGINTYIPRAVKSLKRRLNTEQIDQLKLTYPLRMLEDGLFHAQKVYSGVYEFTNLVKEGAVLTKSKTNIKLALNEYLKLTAYKDKVQLNDNLPELKVNESLFCTAVDNYIRNGLKYNDNLDKLVKVYAESRRDMGLLIVVEDNGRGLTPEEFRYLSRPYTRKEGQKESGTGLGLNISLSILKTHGFSVWAEKKDNGTKIIINTHT